MEDIWIKPRYKEVLLLKKGQHDFEQLTQFFINFVAFTLKARIVVYFSKT